MNENNQTGGYKTPRKNKHILPSDVLSQFLSINGLIEQVFGEYIKGIVYSQDYEITKNVLKEVYGFKNIEKVAPKIQENKELYKIIETIFRFEKVVQNENN